MADAKLVLGIEGGPTLGDYVVRFNLPVEDVADVLGYYAAVYFPDGVAEGEGDQSATRAATPSEIVTAIATGMARGIADQVTRWKKDEAARLAAEATVGIEMTQAI